MLTFLCVLGIVLIVLSLLIVFGPLLQNPAGHHFLKIAMVLFVVGVVLLIGVGVSCLL